LKKLCALVVFLLYVHQFSIAQYADLGSGSLRNEIWWLDWAGLNMANGASKTFTTTDGLSVTVTFSNVSPSTATPNIMNTWMGAILHQLYNFSNPTILPALWHRSLSIAQCTFTMEVTATRGGNPVPCTFIAADAEASNLSEITRLTTDGSNWQTVDFYRNSLQTSNPLTGCNTQTISIYDTYGGSALSGQNPVVATTTTTGSLKVDVVLDHQAFGSMAVAFGIMAPIDRGDLPASYGTVQHEVKYSINNGCNYQAPLPSATLSQNLKLGTVPGDADASESLDENVKGADEDGAGTFTAYNNAGTYSLLARFNNTTGSDAYLTGWFDYNRNGVFDNGESVTVTVPDNTTSATLTWTGLPTWLPQGTATDYAFRFRLSSDMAATQNATGFAKDGEVEDYIVPAKTLCNISIQTINDRGICNAQAVTLTTTGTSVTSYSWGLPTFLNDATIASPVSTPTSDITYTVTGSNPQGCEATDQVTLTVKLPPVISINNDTTFCPGTAVQLSANAPGALSYTWSPQASLDNSTIPTPMATPTATTTYVVKVDAGAGCVVEDSVKITLHTFYFDALPDHYACIGVPHPLLAWGGDEYTWLAPDNSVIGRTSSISVRPTTTQTYRVIIKENTCNNSVTRSILVTLLPSYITPVVTKTNDVDCNTKQATLHASGALYYGWYAPGTAVFDIFTPSLVVTPTQTTTYYVSMNDGIGCGVLDSITVIVNSRAAVAINNDTTICSGTAVQLIASVPGAISYTWSPQIGLDNNTIPSPVAQPTVATMYVVKTDDGHGCIGEDSVKIALHGAPNFMVSPANATVCEKEPVLLTASGGDEYTWLAADNSLLGKTAAITVQPAISQTYSVIIKENICNTTDTRNIPVEVNNNPSSTITKSNDVDCDIPQATLHVSGGITYAWDAVPGIRDVTSAHPVVAPQQTTTYYVTITDSKGCSSRDSVTVLADYAKVVNTYAVPSAFTPNRDGHNDCFGLRSWGQVTQLQFQVFNRWGERVFSTTDPAQCWNGIYKGVLQPAGGYAYTIKAVTPCGTINRSGMIMLIK